MFAANCNAQQPGIRRTDLSRIYYICNWTGESGGIKVLYDHVRLLRSLGHDARLGAYGAFRRCGWFAHDPATIPGQSDFLSRLCPEDTVVLPEFCIRDEELIAVNCRQIVFVQNPDMITGPLWQPRFERFMVPSHVLVPWMRDAGCVGRVDVVPGFLERELIRPARKFCVGAPRFLIVDREDKNRGEPVQARDALRRAGFAVTYVDSRMSRDEFVRMFARHDVYLHLSYREGFPISILEAFGAGCAVVGFSGRGGLEFMVDGENCWVVDDGDWSRAVAICLKLAATPRGLTTQMLARARTTAIRYASEGTAAALGRCFGNRQENSRRA